MTERKTLASGIAEIINSALTEVHTCMPGQVVSFDADEQTVSVQPCLQRRYLGDDDPTTLPILEDVPVVYPGSGNWWVTFDIDVDSYVLLIFSERAISAWLDSGGVVDPDRRRKFSLSDAFALPGVNPGPDVLSTIDSDALTIRSRDGATYVKLNDDGTIELNGSADFAVAFNDLKNQFDDVKSKLNSLIGLYNAHTHAASVPIPASSATISTANIDNAKVASVKLP